MRYLLNTGKSKTSVRLGNNLVHLEPVGTEGSFVALNNNEIQDANKTTTLFFDLKVVDESEILQLKQNRSNPDVADKVGTPTFYNLAPSIIEKRTPDLVSMHNDKGDRITAYNLELFNAKGTVIGTLGVQYNEDLDSLFISTEGRDLKVLERFTSKSIEISKEVESDDTVSELVVDLKQVIATPKFDPVADALAKASAKKKVIR